MIYKLWLKYVAFGVFVKPVPYLRVTPLNDNHVLQHENILFGNIIQRKGQADSSAPGIIVL